MNILKRFVLNSIRKSYIHKLSNFNRLYRSSRVNITEEEILSNMEITINIVDTIDLILKDL